MVEIPLTSAPEQLFSISLSGTLYDIRVVYNTRQAIWSISIYDRTTSEALVEGVALLIGVNILNQYNLPITNLYMVDTKQLNSDATSDNLGSDVRLVMLEESDG